MSQIKPEFVESSKEISDSGLPGSQHSDCVESTHDARAYGELHKRWRSIQRYIWDDPDKSAAEKRFLLKLDIYLLTYTCLGYFCKNLDQANISNAYVSGMREALSMDGSQLTYASNVFTAGYVIGQLPAVILVTKIRPSILVSVLEVLWSVFTFTCSTVQTTPQLYALRFLIGLCEGAFFPCITYIIGSWYTRRERAKRMTIFYSTATSAAMFSGYLQAGAYNGLMECLVELVGSGCIIGYFFNPDFPENTRAFYLSPTEASFARDCLVKDGYKPLGSAKWTKTKVFTIMEKWQFSVLPIAYMCIQSSYPNQQPVYALWLKSNGHSIYQINVWPTGQQALAVVAQIAAGMLTDSPLLRGNRWQAITSMQTCTIIASIILAIWNVPDALRYVAFYASYMSAGVPGIFYAWFPDLIPDDHEMRGFMIAFSNVFSYVNQIWFVDAVWRTVEAPAFRAGYISASVFGGAVAGVVVLMYVLERRDRRSRMAIDGDQESSGVVVIGQER